jgi:hypothetical protein
VESQVDIKEPYLSVSAAEISKFNNSMYGSYRTENELKEKLTALKGRAKLWCGETEYNENANEGGWVGPSKHNCRKNVFIGLRMTTCFGRAWPSSGHKLVYD